MPPFDPAQVHDHGPEPDTELAVPVEQRLVVGAVETVVLFEVPQVPLTRIGVGTGVGAGAGTGMPFKAPQTGPLSVTTID